MELFSAERLFFSPLFQFRQISAHFCKRLAAPRHGTRQSASSRSFFFFSGPERVSFFQPVLVRPSSSIHHSSVSCQLPRDLLLTNTNLLYGASIFISVRPSVPGGVCLLVAAASRNAAVNLNPLSEER